MQTSEAGIPPITKLSAGDLTAFRLQPVQIRMAVYERPDPGRYDELRDNRLLIAVNLKIRGSSLIASLMRLNLV